MGVCHGDCGANLPKEVAEQVVSVRRQEVESRSDVIRRLGQARSAARGGTRAEDHARRVAYLWRQAAALIPSWPQRMLPVRELESRCEMLEREVTAAGAVEPAPVLHPNLPQLYRRRVERLEQDLLDPELNALATAGRQHPGLPGREPGPGGGLAARRLGVLSAGGRHGSQKRQNGRSP